MKNTKLSNLSTQLKQEIADLRQEDLEILHKLRSPRIFVDNGSIAFFDVTNPKEESIDVRSIRDRPMFGNLYGQDYNYYVGMNATDYFKVGNYDGIVNTVSVTSPCIVFCAYSTDKNGKIISSGIYHAQKLPGTKTFKKRFSQLINEVRLSSNEMVRIKAVGSASKKDDPSYYWGDVDRNGYIDSAVQTLVKENEEARLESLLLGGKSYKVTEFYPQTAQLITYFRNDLQKTVI